ncbi:MAG TPA: hypothetical protein VK543_06300 [Puia sp.]|nr:hypothetical protein [Puia sp.]
MHVPIRLTIIPLLLTALSLRGQQNAVDLYQLAQTGGITVQHRVGTPLNDGKMKGLRLSAQEGDGVAWLSGISFANGTIELDIRGKDVLQQSFVGIAFHGVSRDSLEAVYFRPFNFRSTDSVRKAHAVEYVFHPDFPWEKLRREHPGQYEKPIDPPPAADQWFHVKIVVHHPEVKVYVNGNATPCLVVQELNMRRDGKIGLWVGNNSDGDFSGLTINNQQ